METESSGGTFHRLCSLFFLPIPPTSSPVTSSLFLSPCSLYGRPEWKASLAFLSHSILRLCSLSSACLMFSSSPCNQHPSAEDLEHFFLKSLQAFVALGPSLSPEHVVFQKGFGHNNNLVTTELMPQNAKQQSFLQNICLATNAVGVVVN